MANLPTRNNNPGDLRNGPDSFHTFGSPKEGYAALLNDLTAKQSGNTSTGLGPNSTLAEFASKYAPPSDNNDTAKYAADLANQLGVAPNTPIGQLDVGKWADAVSKNEGYQSQYQTYNPQPFSNPSAGTNNPATQPGVIDFSGLPTVVKPEDNSKFKAGGAVGAVQDASHGFAKGALQGVAGLTSGLVKLGGGLEGLVGMKTAQQQAHTGAAGLDSFSGQQGLQSNNTAEKVGKGLETAVEVLAPLGAAAKATGVGLAKAPSTVAKIAETIAPKLSAKEAAATLNRLGGTKGSLLRGAKINTDPSVHRMAEAIMEHVPEFKAKGSLVENLGHVKNAVGRLATDLEKKVVESGKDRIYPVKELGSAIGKAIEKQDVSIGLKGTQYEKQAVALKDAALQIAREKGGKVSDLLPARKEFDDLVDKIYPNLYDREYTPIRNAVKSVRDAMTDFTEKHLPEDVGLKKSYSSQTRLIRAGENLAAKAVSGAEKEIGKSGIKGLIEKHPRITGAVAATAGYQALRNTPIIGNFLP